jgi:hypothetical protein
MAVGGGSGSGTARGTGTSCGPVDPPCSTQHDGTRLGSQVGVIRSAAGAATAATNKRTKLTLGRRMTLPAGIRSRSIARAAVTFTQGYGPWPCRFMFAGLPTGLA